MSKKCSLERLLTSKILKLALLSSSSSLGILLQCTTVQQQQLRQIQDLVYYYSTVAGVKVSSFLSLV